MTNSDGKTKYPVVLVHGIVIKDFKFLRAFGRIEKNLKKSGYLVYTAKTDGFGTIENNAAQLKAHICKIIAETGCDKVNIIAHSKGGLDSRYMIERLDGKNLAASLTTLCTPHKGSPIASFILRSPRRFLKFVAFWINLCYRVFGDKHPDSLKVCEQLQLNENAETAAFIPDIYCQSFSTTLEKSRDDFIMGIPLMFSRRLENINSDGLVSNESAKFGNYRGEVGGSVSHTEIAGFSASKKKRKRIYEFYAQLCEQLAEKGF